MKNKQGLTLTELIIAVVLLGTVFAAATTFNAASYKLFYSQDKYTQTLMDISPAMEMISKSLFTRIGTIVGAPVGTIGRNPGFRIQGESITIRQDTNGNGHLDNVLIDKDEFFERTNSAGIRNQIRYYPDFQDLSSYSIIANRITSLSFTPDVNNYSIKVRITARYNPAAAVSPDNPEVILETTVAPRLASIN